MKKKMSKLNLNSQTIRALTNLQLGSAVGGVPPTSYVNGSYCCTANDNCPSVLPTACISDCWFC
jgi:hypothetical protein